MNGNAKLKVNGVYFGVELLSDSGLNPVAIRKVSALSDRLAGGL